MLVFIYCITSVYCTTSSKCFRGTKVLGSPVVKSSGPGKVVGLNPIRPSRMFLGALFTDEKTTMFVKMFSEMRPMAFLVGDPAS